MAEINATEFVLAGGPPMAPVHHGPGVPPPLPGLGRISPAQRLGLRLDRVDAGLALFGPVLTGAGQQAPTTADIRAQFVAEQLDRAAARNAVWALHINLLSRLSAAEPALGKAYGLGRALKETCEGQQDRAGLRDRFGHYRLENLRSWLNDLATALPTHSAKGVLGSLVRWEAWIANALAAPEEDFDVARATLNRVLARQAQMWRSVLGGEKDPRDSLTADDYVEAAVSVARRGGRLARTVLFRYAAAIVSLLVAVALLIVFVLTNSTSQILTGLGAAAAAVGITWKGVGSVGEKLALALGKPLWGAEIDTCVTDALTYLPTGPVTEPPEDVFLKTPAYLKAVGAASAVLRADPTQSQIFRILRRAPRPGAKRLGLISYLAVREHFWRRPSSEAFRYWLVWAEDAGYLDKTGDGYRLTGEGSRLALLPARRQGTVRAALSAGRQSTDG